MAYEKTNWKDHVLDGEGKVVQQGTPVNAGNLNKMEEGIANSVSKDGGDTIVGGVKVKNPVSKNGGGISSDNNGTDLTAFDDLSNDAGNRQVLKVNTPSKSDKDTAVQLQRTVNGETETFNLLHSGNKNQIKPEDVGAAPTSHNHNANDINSGTLSSYRLPTVPITKGGTGATTNVEAFKKLAEGGAIVPLANASYRDTSAQDESGFNAWLNGLLNNMPDNSSMSISFCCSAIGSSTYLGRLNKHTSISADVEASTSLNNKQARVHKSFVTGSWGNTKYLTDEIQPQDIGAAPDGYGLGGASKLLTSADDLNNITANGWYYWNGVSVPKNSAGTAACTMLVCNANVGDHEPCSQTVFDLSVSCKTYRRTRVGNAWLGWVCTSHKSGTVDLTAGTSVLENGELYFVYE